MNNKELDKILEEFIKTAEHFGVQGIVILGKLPSGIFAKWNGDIDGINYDLLPK